MVAIEVRACSVSEILRRAVRAIGVFGVRTGADPVRPDSGTTNSKRRSDPITDDREHERRPLPSLDGIPKGVAIDLMAEALVGQLVRPADKVFTDKMINLLRQGLKAMLDIYQLPIPTYAILDKLVREACKRYEIGMGFHGRSAKRSDDLFASIAQPTPLPPLPSISNDAATRFVADFFIRELVRPDDKAFTGGMIALLSRQLEEILNVYQLPLPTNGALDELVCEACRKHGIPLA